MYGKKLTAAEITARMVELRNLRKLHAHDREQIGQLKAENGALRALVDEQQAAITTFKIQIAELQTMVFGKKKPPRGGTPIVPELLVANKLARTKASYRRPIPPATAITADVVVPLPAACVCGGSFDQGKTTIHDCYEEDVPLPELTPGYQAKLVTKYIVERSICLACGKVASGKTLGGQAVLLGPNVRLLVAHLVSVVGMSYSQVAKLLLSLYGLAVSSGEIAGILQAKHQVWLPAYNRLTTAIRASPVVHIDETPWPIQANDHAGSAWVLADAGSPSVCYALEQSRGAPIAQALLGADTDQPFTGIRVSDDYGPYRNPKLPGTQQLCWAHLYRAIRDLRYNDNLPEEQLPYVVQWYEQFAAIYQDVRMYLTEPYDVVVRDTQTAELWQRVQALASQTVPYASEPDKLTRLKAQLLRAGKDRLFVCLLHNTPCDNNRAERDLRQLVLKRKRSFGSQTEKGAKALATILSVCTTTWRIQSQGYFRQLALLG